MKKLWKRALSLVCFLSLVIGAVLSSTAPIANATQDEEVSEWVLYSDDTGMNFETLGDGLTISINNAGVVLPNTVSKHTLALQIKLDIKDDSALTALQEGYLELAQDVCDVSEIYWPMSSASLTTGVNEVQYLIRDGLNFPGEGELFDLTKEINWFRIFTTSNANGGAATLLEVKLVDISESGLGFGETDTYLQLSKPLNDTPEVIEVSVKMDAVAEEEQPEETTPEWTLMSAGDAMNAAVSNIKELRDNTYRQAATTGTVSTGETGPAVGTTYSKIMVQKDGDNGGKFGFCSVYQGVTTPSIPSEYKKDDLAVAFWIWSPDGTALPSGVIALSSNGWSGDQEIRWFVHETVNKNLKAGWNYIQLDLDKGFAEGTNAFDYTKMNYIFWHSDGNLWTTEKEVRITDVKLVVKPEPETEKIGTILAAGEQLNAAMANIKTVHSNYVQEISTGTVAANENGPKAGTTYSKSVVKVDSKDGGRFGFWAGNNVVQLPTIPTKYGQSDLYVSFWLYSPDGSALPGGAFVLTNDNWAGANEMRWWADSFINPNLKAGWNYIELGLGSGQYSELNGNFDYTKINHAYWYSDGTAWTGDKEIRITDINLIGKAAANGAPTILPIQVTATEVNLETLLGNQMIFSNTNGADDQTYALYVTSEGCVALHWGDTQYTLDNYDVRTGDWVDIKVVRNDNNKMEFYINGQLKATSEVAEADDLGDFTIAHCIGADANGDQLFNGRISELHLYCDVDATEVLGDWALKGDIQYVLETMTDASANGNAAICKGTRADDWIDYDKTQYNFLYNDEGEEDYWSIMFIPDIQNLTQTVHGYDQVWYNMADWIVENIEDENVKHVIGAGDSTWDNLDGDYAIAREGFDKFTNLVSWSNMVGNHEYDWSIDGRDSTRYQQYFGEEYIAGTAASGTYVGCFDDPAGLTTTENSYYRFSVNGVKWMVLQLEYFPRLSVLEWAEEVARSYPEDNIIFTTHGYIGGDGNYITSGNPQGINGGSASDGTDYLGTTTEPIWNTYLKDCENIKLILCGHSTNGTGAIVERYETNTNGDTVPVLMINAQDKDLSEPGKDTAYYDYDALGMISILRFSADGTQVALQYYAPKYEKSFSPTDKNGNRNSNAITLTFDTETCSHTNTTIVVNQNNADVEKEGYTGDTYCKDCDTILAYGSSIPAKEKDNTSGEGVAIPQPDTEAENKTESPATGDNAHGILWIGFLLAAGFVTIYVLKTRQKGE